MSPPTLNIKDEKLLIKKKDCQQFPGYLVSLG